MAKEQIGIRIETELLERIKELADGEQCSLSNMIVVLLKGATTRRILRGMSFDEEKEGQK